MALIKALFFHNARYQKYNQKTLKVTLIIVGVIALSIFGLQFWFVNNAEGILKRYIYTESDGAFEIELAKIKYRFLSNVIEIHNADLNSTDTLEAPITYHFRFKKLSLKLSSVWPLIFENRLSIESIDLSDPVIRIFQWRKGTDKDIVEDQLSIPQEMGKIYNSMLDVLDAFSIRRIKIDNASISMINKLSADNEPVTISRIFFEMSRPIAGQEGDHVEPSLSLTTSNQDISLPGDRHKLSFKKFNLQLFRQRIELDSCIITALGTDSIKNNYEIFFNKLVLDGVDFNKMYSSNLIKADTVFCESPFINLNLYRTEAVVNNNNAEKQDPGKIIRDLGGNLDLAYVGVKNVGIDIDINDVQTYSFINSFEDNFEIRGLRINPEAPEPVSVQRFDMTLRDYQLNNKDSSMAYTFDSLQFLNRKIVLHQFSILNKSTRQDQRDETEVVIPYFELTQLDWAQLLFDQNLEAKEALLVDPVFKYTKNRNVKNRKQHNVFEALQSLDSLLALERLNIVNGQVKMVLGPTTTLSLEDLNIDVYSNELLRSTDKEAMQNAVERISFTDGKLQLKDITVELHNARYTGNKLIYADVVSVSENNNKIKATIKNTYLDNLQVDDEGEIIELDGLQWESAKVALQVLPSGQSGINNTVFNIKNVLGHNTQFDFSTGNLSISTLVNKLNASLLHKEGNGPVYTEDFFVDGKDLNIQSGTMHITGSSYFLQSHQASYVTQAQVEQIQGKDSVEIKSSLVKFNTNLNDILSDNLHFTNFHTAEPIIKISKWSSSSKKLTDYVEIPEIRIDELTATEPIIHVLTVHKDSLITVDMPWNKNSQVKALDFKISNSGIDAGTLMVNTTDVNFIAATGENFNVEKGKVDLKLTDIHLGAREGSLSWNGLIEHLLLENASGLNIGKSKKDLHFEQASMGNLSVNSENIGDFNELLKTNVSAWLKIPTGHFSDTVNTIKWYNAEYDNSNKTLTLDSIVYHPTQSKEEVMRKALYELDYIAVNSGKVEINGLDIEKFKNDSSFFAQSITFNNPAIKIFRDKKPPKLTGVNRPLPVDLIKSVALPVNVHAIEVIDGYVSYTEKHEKSRKEGTFVLTGLNGKLQNIRNFNLLSGDSLIIEAQGQLMDEVLISLSAKESYTDSLSSFIINIHIDSSSIDVLNPVLIPIANVKIVSGELDSLHMVANARTDFSLGTMDMHYQGLRIKFIKDGNPDKSTVFQHISSYLVNNLVINKNSSSNTGVIYYKREDRSFFNYIVKMALSGIASSVGIKKNHKYIKQYEKEVQETNVPPVIL